MGRPELPPVLLGELRSAGIDIMAKCGLCGRISMIAPGDLVLPDDADMSRVARALKCTECGRAGGNGAHPEPAPWVRYLRRTGQRHREPWYAPMIRDQDD